MRCCFACVTCCGCGGTCAPKRPVAIVEVWSRRQSRGAPATPRSFPTLACCHPARLRDGSTAQLRMRSTCTAARAADAPQLPVLRLRSLAGALAAVHHGGAPTPGRSPTRQTPSGRVSLLQRLGLGEAEARGGEPAGGDRGAGRAGVQARAGSRRERVVAGPWAGAWRQGGGLRHAEGRLPVETDWRAGRARRSRARPSPRASVAKSGPGGLGWERANAPSGAGTFPRWGARVQTRPAACAARRRLTAADRRSTTLAHGRPQG
jgi:hypothetical protein